MLKQDWTIVNNDDALPPLAPQCDVWFVATTTSGSEARAIAAIERAGHKAWTPMMVRWLLDTKNKRRVKVTRALFSGYLFVSPNEKAATAVTEGTWTRWLNGRREASGISPGVVALLSAHQGAGRFIDNRNAPDKPERDHAIGSIVEIETGPMSKLHGIVEKAAGDRIDVLMSLMGRQVRVSVASGEAKQVA